MTASFDLRAGLEHRNVEPGTGSIWASISIEARGPALETERAPLAVALVVDVSGSMAGDPLAKALQSCKQIIMHVLGAHDALAIITFADHAKVCCGLTTVDESGKALLQTALLSAVAGGSTNLHDGLGVAAGILHGARGDQRRVLVVLSDGRPNRGLRSPAQLGEYVRSLGMAASSLGFGASFDEDVLDAIATAGSGRYSNIREPALARTELARAVDAQAGVVADRMEVRLRPSAGVEVVQVLPSSALRFGAGEVAWAVGDVFVDESRALAVELRFELPPGSSGRLLEVTVNGHAPATGAHHRVTAALEVDLRAGERVGDSQVQREVELLRADATRLAARTLADGGALPSAAALLREAIGRIDALPGFIGNDASPLAELREELVDLAAKYERHTTQMERAHHRKAAVAYKPASPSFRRPAREKLPIAAQMVGLEGPVRGQSYLLWSETLLGRSSRCDIAIDDASISRNHTRIQFVDDHFLLVDLGSTTGTLVNGRPVQSARLAENDVIQIGVAVLRFESRGPAQESLPFGRPT